jgi:hypothetical protein
MADDLGPDLLGFPDDDFPLCPYGFPAPTVKAATPKCEAKRHETSGHSHDWMAVPLSAMQPQTLPVLLTYSMSPSPGTWQDHTASLSRRE